MSKSGEEQITAEMLQKYYECNKQKKEIELEMKELKEKFHQYFNKQVGLDKKGELTINGFKLQRQVKKSEKYITDETVKRLEELQMNDLIETLKKPDEVKIEAAFKLNLLKESDLLGCKTTSYTPAISVKPTTPR